MRELQTLIYFIPLFLWLTITSLWSSFVTLDENKVNIHILSRCDFYLTGGNYWFVYLEFAYDNLWIILLAAIPYTIHFLVPFVFGFVITLETYLKTGGCKTALRWRVCAFFWTFGVANLIGVFIQWIFPSAPPWWFDHKPFGSYNVTGDPAIFSMLDTHFNNSFFTDLYSKSPIVFGSFPSLHAAWPIIACYFTMSKRHLWKRVIWPIYLIWIWWAAVYSKHHFIVDVLGGVVVSVIAILAHKYFLKKPKCKLRQKEKGIEDEENQCHDVNDSLLDSHVVSKYIYFHNCHSKHT